MPRCESPHRCEGFASKLPQSAHEGRKEDRPSLVARIAERKQMNRLEIIIITALITLAGIAIWALENAVGNYPFAG